MEGEIAIMRNEFCHCGSGKKYKKCCMREDQDLEGAIRSKAVCGGEELACPELEAMMNEVVEAFARQDLEGLTRLSLAMQKIDPKHSLSAYVHGLKDSLSGDFFGAIKHFEAAVAFQPKLWVAWINQGLILSAVGMYKRAESCFMQVLDNCQEEEYRSSAQEGIEALSCSAQPLPLM